MTSTNEAVLTEAYAALARRDADGMNRAYADDATFEDPVFGRLNAAQTRRMWSALLKGETLKVTYTVTPSATGGVVVWIADYVLSGRPVHNVVTSTITLRDGKVIRQSDVFDFPKWVAQAKGGPIAALARFALTRPLAQALIRKAVRRRIGI